MRVDQLIAKLACDTLTYGEVIQMVKDDTWQTYDTAVPVGFSKAYRKFCEEWGVQERSTLGFIYVYFKDGRQGPLNVYTEFARKFFRLDILSENDLLEIHAGLEMLYEDMKADMQTAEAKNEPPF